MKEVYETPEIEVVEFETEDIITTSGNDLPEIPLESQNECQKAIWASHQRCLKFQKKEIYSVATTTKKVTDSITTKSPNNTTTISQTETTVSTTHQTETTVIPTESKVEITPEQDVNELPFVPAFQKKG